MGVESSGDDSLSIESDKEQQSEESVDKASTEVAAVLGGDVAVGGSIAGSRTNTPAVCEVIAG